ncbi:MAG: hypothetical protein FWH56_00205 [Betaproteobacteria bacterium]|nr:hypothetical protein [Betaproteobacteria bacterium]
MKYPLIAAALLALAVTACDQKEPTAPPESTPDTTITTEQPPAVVEDVPMSPPMDMAPAPVEEAPGETTEPAPEAMPEAAPEPAAEPK